MSLRCAFLLPRPDSSFSLVETWEILVLLLLLLLLLFVTREAVRLEGPGRWLELRVLFWERERELEPESSYSVTPAEALPVCKEAQNVLVRGMVAVTMERSTTDLLWRRERVIYLFEKRAIWMEMFAGD
jgi:hypothetical protein